jgi:predicted HAD superfamily Cof-like phosphohydrolase
MSTLNKVQEFHEAFGVNIEEEPIIPSKERCDLRQKILQEEVNELNEAWKKGDLVEVADAIADIHYVLMGTVLEFGLQDKYEEIIAEVHRSNMSKLDENGQPIYRKDGKVIKSKLYTKPDLQTILKK